MTQGDGKAAAAALVQLRRLESRMRRLITVWDQFRGRLDAEQVPLLARSLGEARRELQRLAALLGLLPKHGATAPETALGQSGDMPPAARTIVR
ncbi:MAG: hypothetical protein ABFS14_12400, partial [Gemmatimonadota bacterium]